MNKRVLGLLLGVVAGIIDVTPMIIGGLPWDANVSAFIMWCGAGFLIASTDLKVHNILKGIITALIMLASPAVLIAWEEPEALIPIGLMTIVLGGLLGFSINYFSKKHKK